MGPRSADRGNRVTERSEGAGLWLQWGRDQLIAEIDLSLHEQWFVVRLQWGRDQLIAEIRLPGYAGLGKAGFNGAAIS